MSRTWQDPHEPGPRRPEFAKDPEAEVFWEQVNSVLGQAKLPALPNAADTLALPLVYVVGAPRSGSTLLSQLLARHLPVGYISNLAARFWQRPSVGIRLHLALLGERSRDRIALESTHGTTPGPEGPHEFGYFWRHWLRLDDWPNHHLSEEARGRLDASGLQAALENEVLATFRTPVMLKNPICGFHAAFLSRLHANSLFLHIVREPAVAAASILESRRRRYGSHADWWSLQPSTFPQWPEMGDPVAESARQVWESREEISSELARPGVTAITLAYEDLCADPAGHLEMIASRLALLGWPTGPLLGRPEKLVASCGPQLDKALGERLHAYCERWAVRGLRG